MPRAAIEPERPLSRCTAGTGTAGQVTRLVAGGPTADRAGHATAYVYTHPSIRDPSDHGRGLRFRARFT